MYLVGAWLNVLGDVVGWRLGAGELIIHKHVAVRATACLNSASHPRLVSHSPHHAPQAPSTLTHLTDV